jgi:hypothetical protein
MLKAKEYKLEDSNIEKLGGDEDRAAKKAAGTKEPAWKKWKNYLNGSILESEGITDKQGKKHHVEIWRIEKFKVRFWPKEEHGQFFSGDSYIVLHTFKEQDKIKWDLHFWLGRDTTQDEAGTAAYKTVELDTLLDDGPVQHREVQEYESDGFLKLFGEILPCGGLRYLDGGIDSGFKHVEPESYQPRLLHLKGKKRVRVTQVPMETGSLNSGDVFILDNGLTVYRWIGKEAGMFEKNKAREVADAIKVERKGKCNVINLNEGDKDDQAVDFFKLLGGDVNSSIKTAAEGGSDAEAEKNLSTTKQLFRLSDASGAMKMTLEASGKDIKKDLLDTNDVFIFDAGAEIFVWVGKHTTDKEKFEALGYAQNYLKEKGRPLHLPITRVLEGGENPTFFEAFH